MRFTTIKNARYAVSAIEMVALFQRAYPSINDFGRQTVGYNPCNFINYENEPRAISMNNIAIEQHHDNVISLEHRGGRYANFSEILRNRY